MDSKKARLFILSAMIAFSLFFIVNEKLSVPGDHFQMTEDVFSLKLHEAFSKYFFYYSEISPEDINAAYLESMTERINHPISWLYYSLLMKVAGNDQVAFEGFFVFREKAQRAREIDNNDITLLSRILSEEISEDEVSSVCFSFALQVVGDE